MATIEIMTAAQARQKRMAASALDVRSLSQFAHMIDQRACEGHEDLIAAYWWDDKPEVCKPIADNMAEALIQKGYRVATTHFTNFTSFVIHWG